MLAIWNFAHVLTAAVYISWWGLKVRMEKFVKWWCHTSVLYIRDIRHTLVFWLLNEIIKTSQQTQTFLVVGRQDSNLLDLWDAILDLWFDAECVLSNDRFVSGRRRDQLGLQLVTRQLQARHLVRVNLWFFVGVVLGRGTGLRLWSRLIGIGCTGVCEKLIDFLDRGLIDWKWPMIRSAPKSSSRHFIFHSKCVCFEESVSSKPLIVVSPHKPFYRQPSYPFRWLGIFWCLFRAI